MSRATTPPKTPSSALRQLPAKLLWRSSAPAALRESWKSGGADEAWREWSRLLAGRSGDAPWGPDAPARLGGESSPLAWGAPADLLAAHDFLARLERRLRAKADDSLETDLSAWLDACATRRADPAMALQALGWAYAAPRLPQHASADTWWRLVETLHQFATEASNLTVGDEPPAELALVEQLLAGELPMALFTSLPELKPLRELRRTARERLSQGLLRSTDGEGLLAAELLPVAPMLVACWTRSLLLADRAEAAPWSSDAQAQYEWLVRQSVRLADRHGDLALSAAAPPVGMVACLGAALDRAGDDSDRAAARVRLRGYKPARRGAGACPEPAVESEWSSLAVLAGDWKDAAPRMVVAYPGREVRVELAVGGRKLLSGAWPIASTRDGAPLELQGDWEQQCWFCDDECAYLELAAELAGGGRLERHFFLAPADGAAMLAEVVLGGSQEPSTIAVTTRLPLAAGVSFSPEAETHDGWLTSNRPAEQLAGVLPLALPEWRIDPRPGSLAGEGADLVVRHQITARNLASPLWLDLKPLRFGSQRTWRQLTVAGSLQRTPLDAAVAYRIQSGKWQWVVYRSLDPPANRTFLGHNTSGDGVLGRFTPTGEVDPYVEVEADE